MTKSIAVKYFRKSSHLSLILVFVDSHFVKPFLFFYFSYYWEIIVKIKLLHFWIYFIHSCSILPTWSKTSLLMYVKKLKKKKIEKRRKVLIYHPAKTGNEYVTKLKKCQSMDFVNFPVSPTSSPYSRAASTTYLVKFHSSTVKRKRSLLK